MKLSWIATATSGDGQTVRRYWEGKGELVFESNTYTGTTVSTATGDVNLIAISEISNTTENTDRMTIRFAVSENDRSAFLHADRGEIRVIVELLGSTDEGQTWTKTGLLYAGSMYDVVLSHEGIATCTLEKYSADIDRSNIRMWSHSDQMARHPGDRFFEFLQEAANFEDIAWP